jgi:hypothetical protein
MACFGKNDAVSSIVKKKAQTDAVWNDTMGSSSSPRCAEAGEEELCSPTFAPLPLSPKT